ncbi:MAG: hypothetical protein ACM3KR_01055 [Deltaproteobacteria bacterium]
MSKKLALTLNVEQDDELRIYIRDLVRGQVNSIIRQELYGMVTAIVSDKIGNSVKTLDVNNEIKKLILEEIKRQLPAENWGKSDSIKEIAREEVKKLIKERIGNIRISDVV